MSIAPGNDAGLQPEPDEVLQVEPEGHPPPVEVVVSGIVRTQDLPRKGAAVVPAIVNTAATTPGGTKFLRADHRRAIARIVSTAGFFVAFTAAAAQETSRMCPWPANTVLPLSHDGEVWIVGTANGQLVGAIVERWAEGE